MLLCHLITSLTLDLKDLIHDLCDILNQESKLLESSETVLSSTWLHIFFVHIQPGATLAYPTAILYNLSKYCHFQNCIAASSSLVRWCLICSGMMPPFSSLQDWHLHFPHLVRLLGGQMQAVRLTVLPSPWILCLSSPQAAQLSILNLWRKICCATPPWGT